MFAVRERRTLKFNSMNSSELRPLDILVLLKKITSSGCSMSYRELSSSLLVSLSSISDSLSRSCVAQLVDGNKQRVNVLALEEFLVHGLRYAFPVKVGRIMRGVPTYISASPLKEQVSFGTDSYVWPSRFGTMRGQGIVPLCPTIPQIVEKDEELYQLLVIVEALRIGRVREREIAASMLHEFIEHYGKDER